MTYLARFNLKLAQVYPEPGPLRLNTCGNPDCSNFGRILTSRQERRAQKRGAERDEIDLFERHGFGAYKLHGTGKDRTRTSSVLEYEDDPLLWEDRRSMQCQGMTRDGAECGTRFSILSDAHLDEEIARLRNFNGVLDGPACRACGTHYLDRPDEFTLNGAHQRSKSGGAPRAVRVLHRPCKGRKGARISISVPHARQKSSKDNLRILAALLNSAGINDIQRLVSGIGTGGKVGMSRIYDRIFWLEQVFLAYEREQLRRWREKVERSGDLVEHRLSHDDMVLTVNWETSADRRHTQLNCAVTADAQSGYVYRIDVDFDPRITPLEFFQAAYLREDGGFANLSRDYPGTKFGSAPLFAWQRPTGRLHEPHFFAACLGELEVFRDRVRRRMPGLTEAERAARDDALARVDEDIERVRLVGEGWFDMGGDSAATRGSFRGMTTRDIYTKAAHFALVKEALPYGDIVLTTEQEATLPRVLPHVFEEEILEDRFAWLAMGFNKSAPKPEIQRKVKQYRERWRRFREDGLHAGDFTEDTSPQEITQAFIASYMTPAMRTRSEGAGAGPFPISNYQGSGMPPLWLEAPTQASGELDKVVGFPILPRALRRRVRAVPFDGKGLNGDLRQELAGYVWRATLQPVSTFMNAVRERISPAGRAGTGGARVGGSYVQGAVFNPRTLIALLNIFRVHWNYFEARPYASPYGGAIDPSERLRVLSRGLRIPGTDERIKLRPKLSRTPERLTPAMRHGMDAVTRRKNGVIDVPNLSRLIYRPWLYANTKVGAKLDRSRTS